MAAPAQLQAGRSGSDTYYTPFPVLGLASNGGQIILTSGGGGAAAAKEVPNSVQVHRYDEATGKLNTIAALNTEKQVVHHISFSPTNGLWLASARGSCRVLELSESANTLTQVLEWTSDTEGKDVSQNFARWSPSGELTVTGGTDGVLRVWSMQKPPAAPLLKHSCEKIMIPSTGLGGGMKASEILDGDFSPDSLLLASCDKSGECRVWDVATGAQKTSFKFEAGQPANNPMMVKLVRFPAASPPPAVPTLVVCASGARGPSYIGLFGADGTPLAKVKIDKLPVTSLALDSSGKFAGVNIVSGVKCVYSLPGLRKVVRSKEVHELPAPGNAMLGQGTLVSGSGDYALHFLRFGAGGGGGMSFLYVLFILMTIVGTLFMIVHIGMKEASLSKGAGEL